VAWPICYNMLDLRILKTLNARTLTLIVVLNDAFCALYPSNRTPCWSFQMA
jgi:hypothetical protein